MHLWTKFKYFSKIDTCVKTIQSGPAVRQQQTQWTSQITEHLQTLLSFQEINLKDSTLIIPIQII